MSAKKKTIGSTKPQAAPKSLPVDPDLYWRSSTDLAALSPPTEIDSTPSLKRLGPLPFSGSGFPLMGFLATLYEHVSGGAREALSGHTTPSSGAPLPSEAVES